MQKLVVRCGAVAVWAALVASGRSQVVINELYYNPPGTADSEEFIELYNAGPAEVDLSGWSISDGIVFAFPAGLSLEAGAYVVVARNPAALQAATGYSGALAWTSGALDNAGEIVEISDAGAQVVDRVAYSDDPPWPTSPDGSGPSLELLYPTFPNDTWRTWRPSAATHGTPGAANSVQSPNPIVISEYPERGAPLAGLPTVSVTFVVPVVNVAAADLVVDGSPATTLTGTGAGPYVFSGFTPPTSGVVQVALGGGAIADESGNAFAGDAWSYNLDVPEVVINELHYHPDDVTDPNQTLEFIELQSIDSAPVDLSGWTIADGVEFTFPSGTILAPGGFLVVAKDPAALTAATGYSGALQWLSGALENGGERVALATAGGVLIDEVTYGDQGVWPAAADGDGPTLELVNPALPNQFGAAWQASVGAAGTPGAVNSRYVAEPAPLIVQPNHAPPIPAPLTPVTITALVLDDGAAAPGVTLYYREDVNPPGAYLSTAMLDDGAHGDGAAGDRVFGAVVEGLADGSRLDFYITANDGASTSTAPADHTLPDALGNPSQTFLCKFSAAPIETDFPKYHLIITEANRAVQETGTPNENSYDATFIDHELNIFYNVRERYRGSNSLFAVPHSYRIDFGNDAPLQSALGFAETKVQLVAGQPARQMVGYQCFAAAGIPAPANAFVRFNVNPTNNAGGMNSHVYIQVERVDGDFLDRRYAGDEDEGNLYRGRHDADLRWEGPTVGPPGGAYRATLDDRNGYQKVTNEDEDVWDDLITLCDALTCAEDNGALCYTSGVYGAEYAAAVSALADVDEWATWFAVHMVLSNKEGGLYRDTGDDYFIYFFPQPGAVYPELADYRATLLPWDLDSVLTGSATETIWRTNVPAVRRFLRNNAFAPIFVGRVRALLDNELSVANMNARIDALPDAVANSTLKTQLKNFVTSRKAFIDGEIIAALTVSGVPASPYTAADATLALSGTLNQAGTHAVLVNGAPAALDVYAGSWTATLELAPGHNDIVVQALGRAGEELERIEEGVFYDPMPATLRLAAPARMLNTKTLTVRAELLDAWGNIDWAECDGAGVVSAVRVSDQAPVPVSIVVFDTHDGVPAADSIRFYNGVGSVSLTLDNGAAEPAGEIEVRVTYAGLTAARVVTVLDDPPLRAIAGALAGPDLHWSPADGVVHLVGNASVATGSTLVIEPGTLIMVDAGPSGAGTLLTINGALEAPGTADEPIFFFASNGPAAMHLTVDCAAEPAWNPNAWRGIVHNGGGVSTYAHVFVTGAGNGPVAGHTRPPVLSVHGAHSATLSDCVLADNPGKCLYGDGSGSYTVLRSLVTRSGHGAEFTGSGLYTLTVEDCWFTGLGHGPESCDRDGDFLNIRGVNPALGGPKVVRGCVMVDSNDDGIDHAATSFTVENCIIRDTRDKAISMEAGGTLTLENVLMFDTRRWGIRAGGATVLASRTTIASPQQPIDGANCASSVVAECIIWPAQHDSCCGDVDYCLLGTGSNLMCGVGNFSVDPLFVAPAACVYDLLPGSPARSAGPTGEAIGWRGTLRPGPTITCPPTLGVACADQVPPPASDADAFVAQGGGFSVPSGSATITHLQDAPLTDACGGTIQRTYRVDDAYGRWATCTQVIVVDDTTPPEFTYCPPNVQVSGAGPQVVTWPDPIAEDNCGAPPTVECTPASGSTFPVGTTPVTCTATDACGNAAVCTFTVTVLADGYLYAELQWADAAAAAPVTRCITFRMRNGTDCAPPVTVPVTFQGTPARGTAALPLAAGPWTHVCAKDERYTLWETQALNQLGGSYTTAAPLWLRPGDTDNDGDVDAEDVSYVLARLGQAAAGPGGCPWDGTRDADFDLDGAILADDFTYIFAHWPQATDCGCVE